MYLYLWRRLKFLFVEFLFFKLIKLQRRRKLYTQSTQYGRSGAG
jgi:hypothetical protein